MDFRDGSVVKNPAANAGDTGDMGLIPGSKRSPGGGHGNPSSVLAWRTPWVEEPGGLQSMGSQRVGHDRAASRGIYIRLKWRQPGSSVHTLKQRERLSVKGWIVTIWSSVGRMVSVTASQFLTKAARDSV